MKKSKFKVFLSLVLAMVFLFNAFIPNIQASKADGFFCKSPFVGALSPGASGGVLRGAEVLPNATNRNYTFQELFSSSLRLSVFLGETEGDWVFAARDEGITESLEGEAKARMEERGKSREPCLTWRIDTFITDAIISLTSGLNNVVSFMVTSLFDSRFPDSAKYQAQSEDSKIVEAIGGTGNNDGIISELANSIYYPLMGLMSIIIGITLAYQGLVKKQFRMTINSVVWVLVALAIGVFIAEKPLMATRFPQKFTSTVVGCIMDGLNGVNCLDGSGSVSDTSSFVSDICKSSGSADGIDSSAAFRVNSLSCGVWKAFSLNSWTQAQFGYSFDELYTESPPSGASLYPHLGSSGVDSSLFCIQTGSSSSIAQIKSTGRGVFDSGQKVCNIAGAQLAVQSGMVSGKEAENIKVGLAKVAASDPIMFSRWALSRGTLSYATESAIGTFFALMALIVVTIKGHIFSFLATISIAFGPLFALLALDPGRGRRLFLGWAEAILGYILKFIATAVVVLVTIMLFGSLMSTLTGMTSVLAAIILSLSMKTYQNQFIEFIGAVNMGGQRLSNMGDTLTSKLDSGIEKTKDFGKISAGAMVGEKYASKKHNRDADYVGALKDAALRQAARSGNRMVKSTAQEFKRRDNKYEAESNRAKREQAELSKKKAIADSVEKSMADAASVKNTGAGVSKDTEAMINVIGLTVEGAMKKLNELGFYNVFTEDKSEKDKVSLSEVKVIEQNPTAGVVFQKDAKVVLSYDSGEKSEKSKEETGFGKETKENNKKPLDIPNVEDLDDKPKDNIKNSKKILENQTDKEYDTKDIDKIIATNNLNSLSDDERQELELLKSGKIDKLSPDLSNKLQIMNNEKADLSRRYWTGDSKAKEKLRNMDKANQIAGLYSKDISKMTPEAKATFMKLIADAVMGVPMAKTALSTYENATRLRNLNALNPNNKKKVAQYDTRRNELLSEYGKNRYQAIRQDGLNSNASDERIHSALIRNMKDINMKDYEDINNLASLLNNESIGKPTLEVNPDLGNLTTTLKGIDKSKWADTITEKAKTDIASQIKYAQSQGLDYKVADIDYGKIVKTATLGMNLNKSELASLTTQVGGNLSDYENILKDKKTMSDIEERLKKNDIVSKNGQVFTKMNEEQFRNLANNKNTKEMLANSVLPTIGEDVKANATEIERAIPKEIERRLNDKNNTLNKAEIEQEIREKMIDKAPIRNKKGEVLFDYDKEELTKVREDKVDELLTDKNLKDKLAKTSIPLNNIDIKADTLEIEKAILEEKDRIQKLNPERDRSDIEREIRQKALLKDPIKDLDGKVLFSYTQNDVDRITSQKVEDMLKGNNIKASVDEIKDAIPKEIARLKEQNPNVSEDQLRSYIEKGMEKKEPIKDTKGQVFFNYNDELKDKIQREKNLEEKTNIYATKEDIKKAFEEDVKKQSISVDLEKIKESVMNDAKRQRPIEDANGRPVFKYDQKDIDKIKSDRMFDVSDREKEMIVQQTAETLSQKTGKSIEEVTKKVNDAISKKPLIKDENGKILSNYTDEDKKRILQNMDIEISKDKIDEAISKEITRRKKEELTRKEEELIKDYVQKNDTGKKPIKTKEGKISFDYSDEYKNKLIEDNLTKASLEDIMKNMDKEVEKIKKSHKGISEDEAIDIFTNNVKKKQPIKDENGKVLFNYSDKDVSKILDFKSKTSKIEDETFNFFKTKPKKAKFSEKDELDLFIAENKEEVDKYVNRNTTGEDRDKNRYIKENKASIRGWMSRKRK